MSSLEEMLAVHIRADKLPVPVREFQFHPTRKFRFDFAWPDLMIAVEVDGGTWNGGRHTRGAGYAMDCIKINDSALLGWAVLRFTGDQVKSGMAIEMIKRAMKKKTGRGITKMTQQITHADVEKAAADKGLGVLEAITLMQAACAKDGDEKNLSALCEIKSEMLFGDD